MADIYYNKHTGTAFKEVDGEYVEIDVITNEAGDRTVIEDDGKAKTIQTAQQIEDSKEIVGWDEVAAGFVTNILAGESRVSDIGLQMQMEERRMRMARVQALQQEAMALKQASGARGAAIAKAVAQNQSITGRSFLAFMDEREEETRQHIDTIRVNAEAGLTTSQMRLSQFGKQKTGARLEAAGGAARSLLAVV